MVSLRRIFSAQLPLPQPMFYPLLRPLLFALDPETAHDAAFAGLDAATACGAARAFAPRVRSAPVTAMGLTFPNRVGLAAGLDKNAAHLAGLATFGFGFLEAGTVTPRAQPGNPKPRMWRLPQANALINRLGFNNDGADAIAERLKIWSAAATPPLFVNIGKNRDVDNYSQCYDRVAPHADVVTLNLSSPNTPGLRDFQKPDSMHQLLKSIQKRGPILVKIAPDLDDVQLAEICDVCVALADGMICTNTTIAKPAGMNEAGGLSGAPLMQRSTDILRRVRERVGSGYPLIGVGGIFTVDDVRAKMIAGADLVQLYTSFIYEGPMLPARLARQL